MKKYIKSFFCIILVVVTFTSCNFTMASSVDDLISPVSPFGDNADIQKAMDDYAVNGYSLKVPVYGDYSTSYNFYDIDGDSVDEALAFYEPSDKLGTIDMAVIKNVSGTWKVVDNITGDGKEIYSVSFCDLTGDGKDEIIICWDLIKNSTNHQLAVYTCKSVSKSIKISQIDESKTVNNYVCVNLKDSNVKQLLAMTVSAGSSSSAAAELFTLKSGHFKSLGSTKLDSHITSYVNLTVGKVDGDVRVYADAVGSDGESMLTEVLYWSDSYDSVISPFYSYSTGLTEETARSAMISSQDVNGDGIIEIPTDSDFVSTPKHISAVEWTSYEHTTLVHTDYSLFNESDGYTVIIPDKYRKNIKVSYDESKRTLSVLNKKSKKTVFTIITVMKAVYDEDNYSGFGTVLDTSGYYVLAKAGNDSDIKISVDDLKKLIKASE